MENAKLKIKGMIGDTIDESNLDCGLNGALYFVQKSKYGNTDAQLLKEKLEMTI